MEKSILIWASPILANDIEISERNLLTLVSFLCWQQRFPCIYRSKPNVFTKYCSYLTSKRIENLIWLLLELWKRTHSLIMISTVALDTATIEFQVFYEHLLQFSLVNCPLHPTIEILAMQRLKHDTKTAQKKKANWIIRGSGSSSRDEKRNPLWPIENWQ